MKIALLQPIHQNYIDIENNNDLFDLILEQREKINEVISKVLEKDNFKQLFDKG